MSVATLIVAASLLGIQAHQEPPKGVQLMIQAEFASQSRPEKLLEIYHYVTPMEIPKVSPLKEWVFPYMSIGMAQPLLAESSSTRFRVFSQSRENETADEISQWTTRYMVRLWDYLYYRCDFDHNPNWNRAVDVYLCSEGDPERGGQSGSAQISNYDSFDLDVNGRPTPKAMIYVFKIGEAKRGIQLSRELAHEYGHALLPQVGGFSAPESYANGDVGERIFLSWLRDDLRGKKLTIEDTFFTSQSALDSYYDSKVKPLVVKVGTSGPNFSLLQKKDDQPISEMGFMEYVGITTYLSRIAPQIMFARYLNLNTRVAADCEKAIVSAAEERETWQLTIPDELKGKAIYIPLVKGTVNNAKVLKKVGNWAMIQPEANKIVTIKNPPLDP